MAVKLTVAEKKRRVREKRDKKIRTMYSKIDRKTKKKVHSVRSLAKVFELSKTRIHEIVTK